MMRREGKVKKARARLDEVLCSTDGWIGRVCKVGAAYCLGLASICQPFSLSRAGWLVPSISSTVWTIS